MTPREAVLLLGLVSEHIRTGEPVGSQVLARKLPINKSPATVRADLHELEEQGYIASPHTSSGRVPSDLGYRFYVDHLGSRHVAMARLQKLREEFLRLSQAHYQLARIASRLLAQLTATAALSSQAQPPEAFESGLRELVQNAEPDASPALREVISLLDKLDEHLAARALPVSSEQAQVYIGDENPLMRVRYSSMVVRDVLLRSGQSITLIILGPKRMPYHRNISLLNAVAEVIEDL